MTDTHDVAPETGRAMEIYERQLRARLEPTHAGQWVAIHVDTEDYALGRNSQEARFTLRSRHPSGVIVTLDIGPAAAAPRGARWMQADPSLSRRGK